MTSRAWTSLSDKSAEALAQLKGSLNLSGLTSLSDQAAATLARHEGVLDLSGLTSLSDNAAEALAAHEVGTALVPGRLNLPPKIETLVAKYRQQSAD